MADLLSAWRTLVARHCDSPDIDAVGRALLARWAEPHRRYHDLAHLRDILGYVDMLAEHAADADAVRLAAWYHDAVFTGRPEDEELSARHAESDLLALGVTAPFIAEVTRLIRMTASHDPAPGDRDAEVLSDADLASLALPAERYRHNSAAIRTEYAHVSDEAYRLGRARVVTALLAAPVLYRTPIARQRWEAGARANLSSEAALLRAPGC